MLSAIRALSVGALKLWLLNRIVERKVIFVNIASLAANLHKSAALVTALQFGSEQFK
jgi:hypothetical protein